MMIVRKRSNGWRVTVEVILIILAFLTGYFFYPITNFEIDPKASIIEYFEVFIAIVALFFIPYFIEKRLKERRVIKDFLIDDIKSVFDKVEKLNTLVSECAKSNDTTKDDKAKVLGLLRSISNSNTDIVDMLDSAFSKRKCTELKNSLNTLSKNFWKHITGDNLMKEDFEINDRFASQTTSACLKFTSNYKTQIIKINNL